MEYQVPQFIEIEDKVVGPLTLKQFIYLAGGGGLCVICFFTLPMFLAILLSIPIAGLAAALAFYRVNGKSFVEMMEAGFNYYTGSKLFLWKREEPSAEARAVKTEAARAAAEAEAAARAMKREPRLTRGKLSELAWSLDVQKPDSQGPAA